MYKCVWQSFIHNVPDIDDCGIIDAYARTLSLYEYIFQEVPPSEIWPSAEKRFVPSILWHLGLAF